MPSPEDWSDAPSPGKVSCKPEPIITKSPHIEMARLLVERGASLDEIDETGEWLLYSASVKGDLEFVRDLLEDGAQVDNTSTGETALHAAIRWEHLEVAKLLLAAGADPNAEDVDGDRPLDYARSHAAEELIQRAGGEPNPYPRDL